MWVDKFVFVVTGFLLVVQVINVAGNVLLIAEGKKTPASFFVSVLILALVVVMAGSIYGWW